MANRFYSQKTYENIILLLRRHYLFLLAILFMFFFLGILPIIGYILITRFVVINQDIQQLIYFLISVYYLFWLYGLFYSLTDYLLDVWIVTDHRIVDMKQNGLFSQDIAETRLSNVQDVSVSIKGVLATLFSFGNVIIQTAGAKQIFEFQQISNPVRVKDTILRLFDEFSRTHIEGVEIHEEPPVNPNP